MEKIMKPDEIFQALQDAIANLDRDNAKAMAKQAIENGIEPLAAIENGLSPGMISIGDRFNSGDCYLPELVLAAKAYSAAMAVLEPEIIKSGAQREKSGVIVIGTVKGDVHSIGKDILAMLFKTRGFEVHSLGEDVPVSTFINKAIENNADIIAMSALLTTTIPAQREVISMLKERDLRDRFKVMVGGGATTQMWADEIGADGYSETAEGGVRVAADLLAPK
jgi:corrinoid protein of di/trimethylamine methyltransferase